MCRTRVLGALFGCLETEMVISVAELCLPPGFYNVGLGGDAVGGSKPGVADEGQPGVGVVGEESGGGG